MSCLDVRVGPYSWAPKNSFFRTVLLEKTIGSPVDCKEIQPVKILKEIIPEYSPEGLILWPPDTKNQLIRIEPDTGKDWRQKEKGDARDKMVRQYHQLSSVQLLSCVWLFATPWTTAHQASLSITNSQSPSKPMSIEMVMPSNYLILCRPLLLLPSIFPSIRVFSNESALHIRWPKYGSFSFNISPSSEHPGLISFRMDWLDRLAFQGTLKSLQQHSSKASILWRAAFFIVQLSHPYMTTGKTIALTRWTFVGKVISLLFDMLSRLVITFLPRSKCLLFHGCNHHLQWFWSPEK